MEGVELDAAVQQGQVDQRHDPSAPLPSRRVGSKVGGQVQADQGGDPGHLQGELQVPDDPLQLVTERPPQAAQVFEGLGRQHLHGLQARGGGHGIAVEGAGVGHGGCRAVGEEGHDVVSPPEGPDRHPAADDLAQGREIGDHAVVFLSSSGGDPERDDLVENEQDAQAPRRLPQELEVALRGQSQAALRHDRIHDDRRQAVAMGLHQVSGRFLVAEGGHQHVVTLVARNPGDQRQGPPVIRSTELRSLVGAVIGARHLQYDVASGEGPRHLDGLHVGFRARIAEADAVHRGQPAAEQPGQLHLVRVGRHPPGAPPGLPPNGLGDLRVGMAVDERRGVVGEIEDSIAVHVMQVASLAPDHVGRMRGETGSQPRIAAGKETPGFPEQLA